MIIWNSYNPVKINFGRRSRALLENQLQKKNILIVCSQRGRKQIESDYILNKFFNIVNNINWIDSIEPNPDLNQLQNLLDRMLLEKIDCVLAFGGGSSIDSAKAFALALSPLAKNFSLKELIIRAPSFPIGSSLPLYVIPTTAGTGSEVTPFATVWDHSERKKLSIAGPSIYPSIAYVDPELVDTLPYDSTLFTGLDAINQAAESIWNKNMTPMSEILAHKALQVGLMSLPRLLDDLNNESFRNDMSEVSLLSGLAISQTRTSLCHAISYPLTAHFKVPHGLACAFTMPAVLSHNLKADDGRLKRLEKVLCSINSGETENIMKIFHELNEKLQVAERVRQMVGSVNELYKLQSQMNHIGRADNALNIANELDIRQILKSSWGEIN